MYFDFRIPEKHVLVESVLTKGGIEVSVMNKTEYATFPMCGNYTEVLWLLRALNSDYEDLILDINPHYHRFFVEEMRERMGLRYNIETPSREQCKEMNRHRLTLIGFYVMARQLKLNANLLKPAANQEE